MRYNTILKRKKDEIVQFQNDPMYTYCFSQQQIRKLVVNAGFEAESARRKLDRHRKAFDEFSAFFPHLPSGTIASTVVEGVPSAAVKLSKKIQQLPSKLPRQPRIQKSLDQARYRDAAHSPSVHESVAKSVDAEGQMRIELEKIHENGMLSPHDKKLLGKLLSRAETSDESIAALAEVLRKYPAVLKRLALRRDTLDVTKQ
jgi:hypothetical protein